MRCSACKRNLPAKAFHQSNFNCKECRKKTYLKYREKRIAYQCRYAKEHKNDPHFLEQNRTHAKRYYHANIAKMRRKSRERWANISPEQKAKLYAYQAAWRKAKRERLRNES